MDKAYIRELNFDCDTFADAKESLNTVLQKLLGTMVGCGAKEGSITMKLDVGFRSETIQNYDAEIDAPEREVYMPQFFYKITSSVKINNEMHGATHNETDELYYNSDTGNYEMRPIVNTAQRSMFDDDMDSAPIERDASGEDERQEDYQYENCQ